LIDIYFAGSRTNEADEFIEKNGYCRLFSYFNDKSGIKKRFDTPNVKGKLFVDSGAFTAWTKGVEIDVDEYIKWLNENESKIHLAGQIDVIPGKPGQNPTKEDRYKAAQKTWENYLYMRSKLKNPDLVVYTFHLYEDFSFLENALKDKTIKYMALGGLVGSSTPQKYAFLEKCFKIIKNSNNPNVKVHGFGMTSFQLLQDFPFASGDSTGWIMCSANGNIYTDVGPVEISEKRINSPSHLFNQGDITNIKNKIESYGFTLEQLSRDYKARDCYNLKYVHEKSKTLNYKGKLKTSLF
jgi:hypothetical protein